MHKLLLTLLLLPCMGAAQTTSKIALDIDYDLYRGTSRIGTCASPDDCDAKAKADARTRKTSANYTFRLSHADAVTYAPDPLPQTVPPATLPVGVIAYAGTLDAGYVKCADEYGTCAGAGTVAYGDGSVWRLYNSSGSVACGNAVFGDPLVGANKVCWLKASPAASSPTSGVPTFAGGVEPGFVRPAGPISAGVLIAIDAGEPINGAVSHDVQVLCNGEVSGAVMPSPAVVTTPAACSGRLMSLVVVARNARGTSMAVVVPGMVVK